MILSIITINYNNHAGLGKTLESVFTQQSGFTDFEQIVIDGGSNDESVKVIADYADRLAYSVSEPDKGIFNAMNKGTAKARGDYLLFLNSGDELNKGILQQIFSSAHTADIIYGNIDLHDDKSRSYTKSFPDVASLKPWFFLHSSLPHQGSFISRRLLTAQQGYDEALKISGDTKFFFQAIVLDNASLEYIPVSVSKMDATGISNSPDSLGRRLKERETFLKPYFGDSLFSLVKNGMLRQSSYLRTQHLEKLLTDPTVAKTMLRWNDLFFFLWKSKIGRGIVKSIAKILKMSESRKR